MTARVKFGCTDTGPSETLALSSGSREPKTTVHAAQDEDQTHHISFHGRSKGALLQNPPHLDAGQRLSTVLNTRIRITINRLTAAELETIIYSCEKTRRHGLEEGPMILEAPQYEAYAKLRADSREHRSDVYPEHPENH